ncbi:MAG: hypothetical protein OIF56_14945 [Cohaesibacter sp.]|nr:hypothetical protein [Cohaesibacter sp.]
MTALPTVGATASYKTASARKTVKNAIMSTVGVLGTSPNKASGIEYNRCYTVSTGDTDLKEKFGKGDVLDQIMAVGKGLPSGVRAANVTVVIGQEGDSADPVTKKSQTIAKLAGSAADGSGAYAFLRATTHQALVARLKTVAGLYDADTTGNLANSIVNALDQVNAADFGFSFINGPSTTEAGAVTARELYNTPDAHMIETAVLDRDKDGNVVTRGASGYIAGLQAGVDFLHDGIPSHVAGMRPIRVAGPAREIYFNSSDGANEGQRLLEKQLGILVRGDAGADFAAGEGGTIYVGAHSLSGDDHLKFYNKARMTRFVTLNLARYYKKYNLINNVDFVVFMNAIMGAQFWLNGLADERHIYTAPQIIFEPNANSASDWRGGALVLDGEVEFRSPWMRTHQDLRPTDRGIKIEIAQLENLSKNLGTLGVA